MSLNSRYKYYRLSLGERKAIKELLKERGIVLAIVFGSFVDMDSFRDIDVAVYAGRLGMDLNLMLKLAADLEERLRVPVDVVPLESVPAKFRHYILTKGKVILEEVAGLYEALFMQTLDELMLLRAN